MARNMQLDFKIECFKAAPWDDNNFRVVYLADHGFIFSRVFRFLKIVFIHIFMNPPETQTNFLYTLTPAKGGLNVPTALGNMLMPSAQRCGGTPLINPFQTN